LHAGTAANLSCLVCLTAGLLANPFGTTGPGSPVVGLVEGGAPKLFGAYIRRCSTAPLFLAAASGKVVSNSHVIKTRNTLLLKSLAAYTHLLLLTTPCRFYGFWAI